MAEKTAQELLADQYLHTASGPAQLVNRILQDALVQAGSGIKGLSTIAGMTGNDLIKKHPMDEAADAIQKYQQDYEPGPVSNQEEDTLRGLAPVTRYAMDIASHVQPFSQFKTFSDLYPKAVDSAADFAGRLSPALGGIVGAVGKAAPNAIFPQSSPEAGAGRDAYELLSKYGTSPLLDDGTTARTLAREQAANSRRYAEGLPLPEVPPSEFVGRQAEHEGAVASRMNEPAYVKAQIHPSQLDPSLVPSNFSAPDNGTTFVAMDPQTGRQIAHVTTVPRGGAIQAIRQDTAPDYQGQGIGRDLLADAISDAHSKGLDFHSDTQLSVPAAKAFEKIPGAQRNEDVTHLVDPTDGDVGVSNNGRPVYTVPKQVPADDAQVGEVPHFDPNSYIGSQAFAEGGEIGAGLEDVAGLLKKYADLPKKTVTEDPSESIHNMNMFMQGAHPSMLDPGGWPKTFYHGTPVFTTKSGAQIGDVQQFDPMAVVNSKITRGTTFASGNQGIRSPGKPGVGKFDSFGSWFSDNPSSKGAGMFAGDDGAIYPVYLNLKNPYQPKSWDEFYNQYNQVSPSLPKNPQKMKAWLTGNGYDGILFPRSGYDGGDHSMAVALEPTQIKSAVGNVGTFDPTDPDITKAQGGSVGMAEGGAALSDIARLLAKYAPETEKSITSTGGATLGREGLKNQGYAVSTHKARQLILDNPPTAEDLAGFVHQNDEAFASDPQAHVGVWHNVEGDGKHYLDVSHVEPDFATAVKKAQANDQLAIFDLANKQEIPTDPGTLHFLHMSNLSDPQVTLDPAYYGTGMKGAEAKRGGTKTVSLYPYDIDQSDIEQPLRSKTPYHVSVPASSMYDMSADPLGILSQAPSYSDAEDAIRDAGYAGYHVPKGQGLFRGQGRLFGPTQATRISPTEARLETIEAQPAANDSPAPRAPPVSQLYDDTGDVNDFARGGPVRMADGGGEFGAGLEDIGNLLAKYSIPAADKEAQAAHLLSSVDTTGSATYNPTTGDLHQSGYAIPHEINRSVSSDAPFSADDIHDFLTSNQDAFANPKAALHIETDGEGNHFMHVAHVEPDYEGAVAAANASDVNGVRELHTGRNLSLSADNPLLPDSSVDPNPAVDEYLQGAKLKHSRDSDGNIVGSVLPESVPADLDTERNQRPATAWRHGQQTVDPAQRNAFPGIYNDPRQVIADANAMVGPEDPLLQRLFGVSRQDMSDIALSRQGNELGVLPGMKPSGRGSASALGVMTPQNEQRLIDVLTEARGTPLYTGMTGFYPMDPLYERFRQIFGDDDAPAKYAQFNTLVGMASPGSDVGTEISRGTSAHWLHNQNRFDDFRIYAGIPNEERAGVPGFPQDMIGVPGHVYHSTAQSGPMAAYLNSGSVQLESPKVPMYIGASGVPEVGFQTDMPVGDAHWARGVGLADTRNPRYKKGEPVVPGSSASTTEMQLLGPWWGNRVAAQAGYQPVPAQGLTWGAFAPYTGVKSTIGAPKLEILATQIGKLANRLGVSPETARDMVIRGQAGAYRSGGPVIS